MPPMDADQLRQYLEFYQDLGVKTVYRRDAPARPSEAAAPASQPSPAPLRQREASADVVKPFEDPPQPASAGESLLQILQDIGDCRRCRLHAGRHKIVFGVGNERSPLVFVGEGPGADEDAQGIPFVGRAGQLLTQMIEGTAKKEGIDLKREDVYICNVVKCRPPDNRTPEADEMEICGQFLYRQLVTIAPKAICVLGGTAAKAITGRKEGVTKMRGKWFQWRDIPVMVTYHPSFLLRAYNQDAKREAWEDLKNVLHFVYD
jgi:DNA polymerase